MTLSRFGWLLPLILLSGCLSPMPPGIAVQLSPPIAVKGIDLAIAAGRAAPQISARGIDFVARYYRKADSRWPTLSAAEAKLLSSLGLNIVTVWESHSRGPHYFSYLSGFADASDAYRQAKALGQPAGSAIYFAVDYDARATDIAGPVTQYFRGIADGFTVASGGSPEYKIGVYGSGAVCDAVEQAGLAQYAWLSVSPRWTGSRSYAAWNIKQGKPLPNLKFRHDSDEAKADYGGFRLAVAS